MAIDTFPRSRAVFFIVDANYFALGLTQARQALLMSSEAVSVHVFLEGDEPESDQERRQFEALQIESGGRLFLHRNQLNPRVPDSFPHTVNLPKLVYGRFFAPEILDAQRILYLDVDILIRGRLDDLFAVPMGEHPLAAVPDIGVVIAPHDGKGEFIAKLRAPGEYFNAGVLLIDRAKWLKSDLDAQARAFFAEHPEADLQDQDFLNWSYKDNWAQLSPRWNFQTPLISLGLQGSMEPTIVHFASSLKPWHPECLRLIPNYTEAFRETARLAGVSPDWRPKRGRVNYTKPFRSLKYRMARASLALGFTSKRSRKRLAEWQEGRRRGIAFLEGLASRGAFVDRAEFRKPAAEPGANYDGRQYWAAA